MAHSYTVPGFKSVSWRAFPESILALIHSLEPTARYVRSNATPLAP